MIEEFNYDDPNYPWITKKVGENIDFTFDITKDLQNLGGDTIAGSPVVTHHSGLTSSNKTNTSTACTVWIAGGNVGEDMWVTCTFQTVGGRTIVKTFYLRIIAR